MARSLGEGSISVCNLSAGGVRDSTWRDSVAITPVAEGGAGIGRDDACCASFDLADSRDLSEIPRCKCELLAYGWGKAKKKNRVS
jgi:hypothetical protein